MHDHDEAAVENNNYRKFSKNSRKSSNASKNKHHDNTLDTLDEDYDSDDNMSVSSNANSQKRKMTNDFKVKYKTEMCKIFINRGFCKFGDTVKLFLSY